MKNTVTSKQRPAAATLPTDGGMDWERFDALTDSEVHAAALADPDAQPWTEADLAAAKPVPLMHLARLKARLSPEAFAETYHFALDDVLTYEKADAKPPKPVQALLHLIIEDPKGVAEKLAKVRPPVAAE
jgi:putative transcriptional regulator